MGVSCCAARDHRYTCVSCCATREPPSPGRKGGTPRSGAPRSPRCGTPRGKEYTCISCCAIREQHRSPKFSPRSPRILREGFAPCLIQEPAVSDPSMHKGLLSIDASAERIAQSKHKGRSSINDVAKGDQVFVDWSRDAHENYHLTSFSTGCERDADLHLSPRATHLRTVSECSTECSTFRENALDAGNLKGIARVACVACKKLLTGSYLEVVAPRHTQPVPVCDERCQSVYFDSVAPMCAACNKKCAGMQFYILEDGAGFLCSDECVQKHNAVPTCANCKNKVPPEWLMLTLPNSDIQHPVCNDDCFDAFAEAHGAAKYRFRTSTEPPADIVILFGRPACMGCQRTQAAFEMAGIKFEFRNFDLDHSYVDLLFKSGYTHNEVFTLPIVTFRGRAYWEESAEELVQHIIKKSAEELVQHLTRE